MNRGNARTSALAFEQLALTKKDRVLEGGFGGGVLLPRLLHITRFTCGVDRSADAVSAAQRGFAGAVPSALGTVESLPLESDAFDKALSVYTVEEMRVAMRASHRLDDTTT